MGVVKLMEDKQEREAKVRAEAKAMMWSWCSKRLDGKPNIKAIRYDRMAGESRDVQSDYLTVEAAIDSLGIRRSMGYLLHVVVRNRSESTFTGCNALAVGQEDLKTLEAELLKIAESEVL